MNFQTKFVVAVIVLLVSACIISSSCPPTCKKRTCSPRIRVVKQQCKADNRVHILSTATCFCCRVCAQKLGDSCGGPLYSNGECGHNLKCTEKHPENGRMGTCIKT
ncbi:Uncharacterised protein g4744 [Pycnogonum litorale]